MDRAWVTCRLLLARVLPSSDVTRASIRFSRKPMTLPLPLALPARARACCCLLAGRRKDSHGANSTVRSPVKARAHRSTAEEARRSGTEGSKLATEPGRQDRSAAQTDRSDATREATYTTVAGSTVHGTIHAVLCLGCAVHKRRGARDEETQSQRWGNRDPTRMTVHCQTRRQRR